MASAVILLPFYQYYLPVEEFGQLAVYTTFSMLTQVLITYSFDTTIYVYYHDYKKDPNKLSQFLSSSFVLMAAISGVVCIAMIFIGSSVFDYFLLVKSVSFFPYGLLSVITAAFQSFFKVNSSLLQSQEKPTVYLWANLVSFSLIAALTIVGLLLFPNTLVGPITGRAVAAIVSGGWACVRIFGEFGFHFNIPLLRDSFHYNNSSFIYQVQLWLINNFDRFIITLYLSVQDVGQYDFAFKCLLVIDFIIGGLYNSFYPKVIGLVNQQTKGKKSSTIIINRYYHGLISVSMLLVSLSILFFPLLFESGLLRAGYREAWTYIPLIGVVYLLRSIRYYFSFPFGALKYNKPLPYIYLGVSIIKITLMFLFIKTLHVDAVIFSAMISSAAEIYLLNYSMKDRFIFNYNPLKIVAAPVLLGALILVSEFYLPINHHLKHGLYFLFTSIVLFVLYRQEISQIKWRNFLVIK